ncbi:MAG: alpha-galactosidase [Clostridia bacterium]|nr:alpha-galactosidase [Clostridia bacterium]
MKLRIPDYAIFYHDGEAKNPKITPQGYVLGKGERIEFDNSQLNTSLKNENCEIQFDLENDELKVYATAYGVGARYILLRWNEKMRKDVKVLGDAYERGYGDLQWSTIRPERCMPWYIGVSNGSDTNFDYSGRFTECFGVKVCPNSMCFWQYDTEGVSLWLDIRNGGNGTYLDSRKLECATVLFKEYREMSAYKSLQEFCSAMCPSPYLPDHVVYGSNNWYYAYGKSTHEEIINDTKLLMEMCKGLANPPYMVIDDGWQPNPTDAPWDVGNSGFPDMKRLQSEMKSYGARTGIWVRYLINGKDNTERKITVPEEWYLSRNNKTFDPSHPEVLEYVAKTTKTLTQDWGFELIKHDFSTFDIFGKWGFEMQTNITESGWSFYDKSKTSAEIVKNFYKTVKDNSNGAIIIGCNCIGHLCATLHQLNRTGDDTSGFEWSRTQKMGVNTLAFRNCQNGRFFMSDADCVGITGMIPWEQNKEWLFALSRSGSPLFVSCKHGVLNESELDELRQAYEVASKQSDEFIPVDWMETTTPDTFLLNGEIIKFNWYTKRGNEIFTDWN